MRGLWFVVLMGCTSQEGSSLSSPWDAPGHARQGLGDTAGDTGDSGLDLVPTMDDMCPSDPNKTEEGYCGCDWIDLDIDGANGAETCVHSTALVDGSATIGLGAVIASHASVGNATIGSGALVGLGAAVGDGSSIGDDSIVSRYAVVGTNSDLGPESILGRSSRIGDDVDARPGFLTLGYGAEIGSNSMVTGPNVVLGNLVSVGPEVTLHEGVVLARGVVVESGAEVGAFTVIGPETQVGANASIGESVRIRKQAVIGDDSTIGGGTRMGRDTIIEAGVTIPADAVMGARVFVGANNLLTGDVYLPRRARIEPIAGGVDSAPTVSISAPTFGSDVSSGSILLAGTATDDRGVASVSIRFNDGIAISLPFSNGSFSQTITVPDDTQTIRVTATDTSGQIGSDMVFVDDCTLDITPPNVWTGNVSSSWSDGGNWSASVAPNGTSDAFICGTVVPQPTLTFDGNVRNLSMSGTATLNTNGRTLYGNGDVVAGIIGGSGILLMPNDTSLRGVVPGLDIRGNVALSGYTKATGAVSMLGLSSLNVGSRTFEADSTYNQDIGDGAAGIRFATGGVGLFNGEASFNGTRFMSSSNLANGTLHFRGDLTVQDIAITVFLPSTTQPIYFDGPSDQTITMRDTNSVGNRLGDVIIASAGVVSVDASTDLYIGGTTTIVDGSTLHVPSADFNGDISIQGTGQLTGSTVDMYQGLTMGSTATVSLTTLKAHSRLPIPTGTFNVTYVDVVGNVSLQEDWDHTLSELRVQDGGTLRTNGNDFTLNGNYSQHIGDAAQGLILSSGDVATFNGDATFTGTRFISLSNLTSGTLRFRGDLAVQDTPVNVFHSGSAPVYFDGPGNQTLNLGHGLDTTATLAAVFVGGAGTKTFLTSSSQDIAMSSLTVDSTATVQRDTTIAGDLLVQNTGTLNFGGTAFVVNGTCTVNGTAPPSTCN